ncbi:MAG: hypothetical protein K2Y22_13955 [Candidatus Obscuribacterales bacterium]|nr:hypothetical protein [Candidatus Obscuribacterales bacterium]
MDQQKPSRPKRRVISQEERNEFFRKLNESVERLKADPEAWAAYQAECKLFDNAVGDGLEAM